MKSTPYDEQQFTDWLFRFSVPTLAWALVFLFFAFAGSIAKDEPTSIAAASFAVPLIDDEVASIVAPDVAGSPEPRDAAVAAHEALDPVGAGSNLAP